MSSKCPWCDEEVVDPVRVIGIDSLSGDYCSSDCLFHRLLADRTTEDAFYRAQIIIQGIEHENRATKI